MPGERVLIVDDEPNIRGLLVRLCQREGYVAIAAEDGAAAVRCLEESEPDVCIADLRLPDADGLQVMRQIKERYPDCEVIILTGYGELSTAVEALRLGAYDYLQKPVADLQVILNAIARALDRRRLAQENARLLQGLQEANHELALRRRQQLQYISYIGQAMSGALNGCEVSRVLVRAILDSVACDAAAVLVLRPGDSSTPWALLGGRSNLAPEARRQLLAELRARLPKPVCSTLGDVGIEMLPAERGSETDPGGWRMVEASLLEVRGEPEGVAVMARHADDPWPEEALEFFRVLVTQGGIALANARLFARAQELATRDGVTGIYNRRHFTELLEAEISRSERHHLSLAVIMLDLDRGDADGCMGLKMINDTLGHQAGDELLYQVATYLTNTIRRADVIARYGGDEFVILAPQTGQDEALALASRVRKGLGQGVFRVAGRDIRLTTSVGVGVFEPGADDSAAAVVSRADHALYLAKEGGGNQVRVVEARKSPPLPH